MEVHLALKIVHRDSTFETNLNRFRILTGRRQTSWQHTSAARSWGKDYLKQIQLVVRAVLELGISRIQFRHPDHSATLPPLFGRLCQKIVFKCVPYIWHDYISSLNQSDHGLLTCVYCKRPSNCTETLHGYLLLRIESMEMDSILINLATIFLKLLTILNSFTERKITVT